MCVKRRHRRECNKEEEQGRTRRKEGERGRGRGLTTGNSIWKKEGENREWSKTGGREKK